METTGRLSNCLEPVGADCDVCPQTEPCVRAVTLVEITGRVSNGVEPVASGIEVNHELGSMFEQP